MKFLNYRQNGQVKCGILIDQNKILDLQTIGQFLGQETSLFKNDSAFFTNYFAFKLRLDEFLEKNSQQVELTPLSEVKILSPVLNPSKIICIGLNYRDHAEETRAKIPHLPMLFSKAPSAIIGMDDIIQIPSVRQKITGKMRPISFVDYEAELATVIGKPCRTVSIEDAHSYILGYTILNDVSARMEQVADQQYFRSKSFDTFAPLGPWIVTSDEIGDPMNLHIECRVNGELQQDSNTQNMNFNVYELVSFISDAITLFPGDIIGTGTPAGVGIAKKPPRSLKSGDLVEMTIENIGCLRNRIR